MSEIDGVVKFGPIAKGKANGHSATIWKSASTTFHAVRTSTFRKVIRARWRSIDGWPRSIRMTSCAFWEPNRLQEYS